MDDPLLTIGEVARRAGVATSTVRFYERRGLLVADARRSGQRRYRPATLRRLVFVGMLQDAGLSLDDIAGVLGADHVADWKAIGRRRLAVLDTEIARLQEARAYLAGALLCRYDHPATDCRIMNQEIDRRLSLTGDRPPAAGPGHSLLACTPAEGRPCPSPTGSAPSPAPRRPTTPTCVRCS